MKLRNPILVTSGIAVLVTIFIVLGLFIHSNHRQTQKLQNASTVAAVRPMKTWMLHYGSFITTIMNDNTKAQQATQSSDFAALGQACDVERSDILTIKGYPDMPDVTGAAQTSQLLLDSLEWTTSCSQASSDLVAGTSNLDANQINKGSDELKSATSHLTNVVNDMNALSTTLNKYVPSN